MTKDKDRLEEDLRRYPPLLNYVRKLAANVSFYEKYGIRSASDMLGNRALTAMSILLGEHDQAQKWATDDSARLDYARAVLDAVPVLWLDAMFDAAKALPLPDHIVAPDVLPYPFMWWQFQSHVGDDKQSFDTIMLLDEEDIGFHIMIFEGQGERGGISIASGLIPYYRKWPDELRDMPMAEDALKLLAFMNSRFVVDKQERPNRGERHQIERARLHDDRLDAEHPIHIIQLRAPEAGLGGSVPGMASVDWKHRWIVRGHYRAQWYPSIRAHRVRWIAAYLKGPTNLPVQLPAVKVVH